MFILVANMVGLIPYTFTVTSHIIITVSLALLVFFTVLDLRLLEERPEILQAVRAERHPDLHPAAGRLHRGVLVLPAPGLAQRPSVREHAGRPHRAEGFRELHSPARAGLGVIGWIGGTLPLGMVVALTALELLVAFLQAYVFTILTCIYLNDAIHPGH